MVLRSNTVSRREGKESSDTTPLKILMYSHDTYGLGHIRRTLAIAKSLRQSPANILILTGSPLVGRFHIPKSIDFVRIPGMFKVTNEQYLPLSMKLESTEVLEIRKAVILATAKALRPDFFIVDKAPLGLKREVVETLKWIKEELPTCTSILGLRDIMDSAQSTMDDWNAKCIYGAMDELYDRIWVYGVREFYDPIAEYRIPEHIASRIRFTGYISRHTPSARDIEAARSELGLREGERLMLVTTGGGGDGYPVVDTFLKAFEARPVPERTRAVIVTGPFLSSKLLSDVRKRSAALGFTTLKFHRYMEGLIGAAQVVVSMGGYNTLCEIVTQRKPLLIVPRTVPREEQLIRAQVLCTQGYCDYLDPRELTPDNLREKVMKLLDNGSLYREKMASFPFTGLQVIQDEILRTSRKGVMGERGHEPSRNDPERIPSHIGKLYQYGNTPSGVARCSY